MLILTDLNLSSWPQSSGEITGEVCLNGHPQESHSFRRCTGYVEQVSLQELFYCDNWCNFLQKTSSDPLKFDEQQPELTVRETVSFSAKLRLDRSDPAVTTESTEAFINQTLKMLELMEIEDLQVRAVNSCSRREWHSMG